jgi:hypothetical protein
VTLAAGAVHPKGSSDVGTVGEWMTRVGNSNIWIADHLVLLFGALLLLLASVAIARSFPDGQSRTWAEAAWITNVIATAVAVLTFLFDGAVVKNVAELWQAQPDDPAVLGAATLATETGFILVAGLQVTTGLVALMFGVAVVFSNRYPRWLGVLALGGGATSLIPGAAHYLAGTSTWSASLVYVSGALIAVWFFLMSARLWRSEPNAAQ